MTDKTVPSWAPDQAAITRLIEGQRGAIAAAPRVALADAERAIHDHYTGSGVPFALDGERDATFRSAGTLGTPMVVKFSNPVDGIVGTEMQVAALRHLEGRFDLVPKVVPLGSGADYFAAEPEDGNTPEWATIWAMTEVRGTPLCRAPQRSREFLEQLGETAASLNRALADFDHPNLERAFHWDLANGIGIVRAHRLHITDPVVGGHIDDLMRKIECVLPPLLDLLPLSAIHNDLNDHNIFVDTVAGSIESPTRVSGIVDFGDLVRSYTVADLAILLAYIIPSTGNDFEAAVTVTRAWHSISPLSETELKALYPMTCLRMCMSLANGAFQRTLDPDKDYLGVSDSIMRAAVARMRRNPAAKWEFILREACGYQGSSRDGKIRRWLEAQSMNFAPVIDVDLRNETCIVLDLSVGSPLVSGDPAKNMEPHLSDRIAPIMQEAGVRVAVGRYDEPRLLYVAPFFAQSEDPLEPRRTLHIGLDLFAPAGTPVFAPLSGLVHAFADNAVEQDYGPVIILSHRTSEGDEFFTLYGHLSRTSLEGLTVGQKVERGERFASFGDVHENVGWSPHLHLQLITDLMDEGTDFAGVGETWCRNFWRSVCPDPNLLVGIPLHLFPAEPLSDAELLAARARHSGSNVKLAYTRPVRVSRGWMQHLFDADGRRYLDAYNNVPHVGHSHPRVVAAAASQLSVLNTNTRYLYDAYVQYSERLTALFPESLNVCFFVNSGSEANELALRLARAATGRRDTIVLEHAYHGHTATAIDISPYKHSGPGGSGAPDWVHVAAQPDAYRALTGSEGGGSSGEVFAADVRRILRALDDSGRGVAAFIAETCPSVGGQIIPPADYFTHVYEQVRRAGGVCIADEVQTGFGRMGHYFWAFEMFNVVPDIVVLGKPMGNGYPMGAVVTTRAIADAFTNGMEFFSTFGGSSVSCCVGMAVLDVLRDENLQSLASASGARISEGLQSIARRHPLVGDVRGAGAFWGVEMVADAARKTPATREARIVVERMRDWGVLIGTDGPAHNVLKIRPPLQFTPANADQLLDRLDDALTVGG